MQVVPSLQLPLCPQHWDELASQAPPAQSVGLPHVAPSRQPGQPPPQSPLLSVLVGLEQHEPALQPPPAQSPLLLHVALSRQPGQPPPQSPLLSVLVGLEQHVKALQPPPAQSPLLLHVAPSRQAGQPPPQLPLASVLVGPVQHEPALQPPPLHVVLPVQLVPSLQFALCPQHWNEFASQAPLVQSVPVLQVAPSAQEGLHATQNASKQFRLQQSELKEHPLPSPVQTAVACADTGVTATLNSAASATKAATGTHSEARRLGRWRMLRVIAAAIVARVLNRLICRLLYAERMRRWVPSLRRERPKRPQEVTLWFSTSPRPSSKSSRAMLWPHNYTPA